MRQLLFVILLTLVIPFPSMAQPLERIVQSLPIFVACANITADDGILTVGIFSENGSVDSETVKLFKDIRAWNHSSVVAVTQHEKVEVVGVSAKGLSSFGGQILWVLDAKDSLPAIRKLTQAGTFTIGLHNPAFEESIFSVLTYKDKSTTPKVERWRLVRFFANCNISDYRFTKTVTGKDSYVGKGCD